MPADSLDLESPLFHRSAVKELVEAFSKSKNLCIYLGAGATIDRTGLSWAALIGNLIQVEFPDEALRTSLIEGSAPLEAASVASEIFKHRFGPDWRDRLNDAIRSRLYQQPASPAGKIVERAVELALTVVRTGGNVFIVTPNYDDFVFQELEARTDLPVDSFSLIVLGAAEQRRTDDEIHEIQEILEDESSKVGNLCLVHLHGLLRSHPDSLLEEDGLPVLSEEDYWATAEQSRRVLEVVFHDHPVLVAGASMTDPPMLAALLATKSSRHARLCLTRIPVTSDTDKYRSELAFYRRRLQHFAVEVVAVDHFAQIAQMMTEFEVAARFPGQSYSSETSVHRYGARLTEWWRQWLFKGQPLEVRQVSHHRYLARRLGVLRGLLEASSSEPIKIEVWVRWSGGFRRLRLWASSIGPWTDQRSMRDGEISSDSRYVAVQAFTTGSSLRRTFPGERWQTFLATPVWVDGPDGAPMALGVVCLASTWGDAESSLGGHNATSASAALLEMHRIGVRLLEVGDSLA